MSTEGIAKTVIGIAAVINAPFAIGSEHIVGFSLFVACAGGAYASFSWGDPVEPRSKMYRLFVSCIIMGMAITLIVNALIEWRLTGFSLTLEARVGLGAFVSCLTRFIMPKIIDSIRDGTWKTIFPFIGKKQ